MLKDSVLSTNRWIYLILFFSAFVIYGNTVFNKYSFDDGYIIENVNVQKGILGIPSILTNPYFENKTITFDYRPITLITFAIEYQFFKQNPAISHFINILLFAIGLLLIYQLLISIFKLHEKYAFLPLVITILFAIHPLHTEVVASLKNRDEILSFIFGLLFMKYGFNYLTSSENNYKTALLAIVFFVLSLLSKLVGLLYLPCLFLIVFFYNKVGLKKRQFGFILLNAVVLLIILISIFSNINRKTLYFENSLIGEKNSAIYIGTILKTLLYHLKMLWIPNPLRFYYGHNLFPVVTFFTVEILFSAFIYLGLIIFSIYQYFKKNNAGLFLLLFLLFTLFYSNFPIPYTGMFSERALFVSSLWFIIFITTLLFTLFEWSFFKKFILVRYILLLFFVGYFSFLTIRRNLDWKDNLTLMLHDIPSLENSISANYILANRLVKESELTTDTTQSTQFKQLAIQYYKQAIKLYPYYPEFHLKLAALYKNNFKDDIQAEKFIKNVMYIDSTSFIPNYELGLSAFKKKDFPKSISYFQKAYEKNSTDSLTLFYYAQSADAIGNLSLSYKLNKELLDLYPTLTYPYMNLGVYYSKKLKDDTAVIYFEKAIELGERNPQLLNQLAIYYNGKMIMQKLNSF
jgi:tetratricopeptide (TPR) repeat protein